VRFTIGNIDNLKANISKIERLYAYKYECPKDSIALIIKGKNIHVLVDGKVQESIRPEQLLLVGLNEETLEIQKQKPYIKKITT
jgi:hypothetical protein